MVDLDFRSFVDICGRAGADGDTDDLRRAGNIQFWRSFFARPAAVRTGYGCD